MRCESFWLGERQDPPYGYPIYKISIFFSKQALIEPTEYSILKN